MDSPDPYNRRNLELRVAEYYASIRKPESEWKTIEDLTALLSEVEHRFCGGDCDGMARLLDLIDVDYLFLWGYHHHLIRLREQLINCHIEPRLQVQNLGRLGRIAHSIGRFNRAIEYHQQALRIIEDAGLDDNVEKCKHLGYLGTNYHFQGQAGKAIDYYQRALALARSVHDRGFESIWLGYLGYAYRIIGELDQSVTCLERALQIARVIGDRREEQRHLGNLGSTYYDLGETEKALTYYRDAVAIAQELGYRRYVGIWQGALGEVYRDLRYLDQAIRVCQESLAIAREVDDRWSETLWLRSLGNAYYNVGQFEEAIRVANQGLAIAQQIGDRVSEGGHLGILCRTYLSLGFNDQAFEYGQNALTVTRSTHEPRNMCVRLCDFGAVCFSLEQLELALQHYTQALILAREGGEPYKVSYCLLGMARVLLGEGRYSEAEPYSREACTLDVPATKHQAALGLAFSHLYQCSISAVESFTDAIAECQTILNKTPTLYKTRYVLATAMVGQAVCHSRWGNIGEKRTLLVPALVEYRRALDITSAPGVVRDALRDLELIRAAGVEGLEPAFELLEGALNE
ncbi:MAG TPA: tetratricopeptide repeat protein [Anaerolineae bacterium]|nr:tetratricopeptide repeat protein [Anaerolineae bacterium]HQI83400.1 tetratricopeptide repeat protein [Anaerolineae bacterium]